MQSKKKGLTLLELIVAITLLTTVLLTASTLLISFKNFYVNFIQSQAEVGEVSLAVQEEMVERIKFANWLTVTAGSRIDISVDNTDPASPDDDTTYTYWLEGNEIRYRMRVGDNAPGPERVIARDIVNLNFDLHPNDASAFNMVRIEIGIQPEGSRQENFATIIATRGRCAQEL